MPRVLEGIGIGQEERLTRREPASRLLRKIEKSAANQLKEIMGQRTSPAPLRIADSPLDLQLLRKEVQGEPTSATFVIQAYIARGLQQRGHQLSFIGSDESKRTIFTGDLSRDEFAPQTWSKSRIFIYSERASWALQRLLKIPYLNTFSNLRTYDACLQCLPGHDLVYERNGIYHFGVAMACRRLQIPFVLYFEADDLMESDIMGEPIKGLLRWRAKRSMHYNLKTADCIISVSEEGKDLLTKEWNVPSEKIVVFSNVADVNTFRPDPLLNQQTRERYHIGSRTLVAFVGNFYLWHDVSTLLEAIAHTVKEHPEVQLILVGDGDLRADMEDYAAELGLGDTVLFTGLVPHNEIPEILAAADVAVVPYPPMDEDLWLSPLKLFEYMASGTAVVASDIGQISEIIDDRRNGLLVPPGSSVAMAEAITKLIEDPELRASLAEAARLDAVQHHSWECYLDRLEQLFAAVVAGESFQDI